MARYKSNTAGLALELFTVALFDRQPTLYVNVNTQKGELRYRGYQRQRICAIHIPRKHLEMLGPVVFPSKQDSKPAPSALFGAFIDDTGTIIAIRLLQENKHGN